MKNEKNGQTDSGLVVNGKTEQNNSNIVQVVVLKCNVETNEEKEGGDRNVLGMLCIFNCSLTCSVILLVMTFLEASFLFRDSLQ